MWRQLQKEAARLQGIKVLTLSAFGDALAALRYQYPNQVDSLEKLSTLPIVVVSPDKWIDVGMSTSSSGALIKIDDIRQIENTLMKMGIDLNDLDSHRYDRVVMWDGEKMAGIRDNPSFNIFRIWKEFLGKDVDFILILDESDSANTNSIMHEVSHILQYERGMSGIHNDEWSDAGQYFGAESEQESFRSEMRFYKDQGKSFAHYVAKAHPNLYEYWKTIKEIGKEALDKQMYDNVVADLNDYKKLWDEA